MSAGLFTTVRYGTSAQQAAQLQADILASNIEILHGSDAWDISTPSKTPKDVFFAAAELLAQREKIEFNFQETTLVNESEHERVIKFKALMFDTIAEIASECGALVARYRCERRVGGCWDEHASFYGSMKYKDDIIHIEKNL